MSLFDDQFAAGLAAIRQVAGDAVNYQTGTATIPLIDVVQGQTRYESANESGAVVTAAAVDFLIAVDQLVDGGNPVEPASGHRILKNGKTYELMTLPDDDRPYRFSDPSASEYRVHTKQIL